MDRPDSVKDKERWIEEKLREAAATVTPSPTPEAEVAEELRAELALARRINERQDEIIEALLANLDGIEQAAKEALWQGVNALNVSVLRDLMLRRARRSVSGCWRTRSAEGRSRDDD